MFIQNGRQTTNKTLTHTIVLIKILTHVQNMKIIRVPKRNLIRVLRMNITIAIAAHTVVIATLTLIRVTAKPATTIVIAQPNQFVHHTSTG